MSTSNAMMQMQANKRQSQPYQELSPVPRAMQMNKTNRIDMNLINKKHLLAPAL